MSLAGKLFLTSLGIFVVMMFVSGRARDYGVTWMLGDYWLLVMWVAFSAAAGFGLAWVWA